MLINRPCTLVRRSPSGATDDYGRALRGETRIETVCELQQARRDEPSDQADLSVTLWSAFFLPGDDVRTGDALVVDGVEYEMVGDPWDARSPFAGSRLDHVEATVKRAGGRRDSR